MTLQRKQIMGLTLVEMLVAMAVGGIILAGGVAVYGDQVQSSRRLAAYSQLQESGRVALDIIERDLRMAGFKGCFSTNTELNIVIENPPATFQPKTAIQGWEASNTDFGNAIDNVGSSTPVADLQGGPWSSAAGNSIDNLQAITTSDVLRVWTAGDEDIAVSDIEFSGYFHADIPNGYSVEQGGIYILGDCENADIVQVCETSSSGSVTELGFTSACSPGNGNNALFTTSRGASITQLLGTTYLVSKLNGDSTNPPALFRARLTTSGAVMGNPQELVQGVESMQILYGENLNNDNLKSVDVYVPADEVHDWLNVISVRISILLQSVDTKLAEGVVPYTFNGVTYDGIGGNPLPSDSRLRRVFTRTITLRNRTLGT
ncbi:type IV pilus assembly protein PilW [Alteromonadaceae bacterium 2753L.S.0a.02]|nr:type IV pilus assembly protein PilW [Alteromonadaceae bacterium 2753L.S.0a.02]